jgi:hypothetical protein
MTKTKPTTIAAIVLVLLLLALALILGPCVLTTPGPTAEPEAADDTGSST